MSYLATLRAVVIDIQYKNFHFGGSLKFPIRGHNLEEIFLCIFSVQRLLGRNCPFTLNLINCELSQYVSF